MFLDCHTLQPEVEKEEYAKRVGFASSSGGFVVCFVGLAYGIPYLFSA